MKKLILLLASGILAVTMAAAEVNDGMGAYPLSFTYDGQAFSAQTWAARVRTWNSSC